MSRHARHTGQATAIPLTYPKRRAAVRRRDLLKTAAATTLAAGLAPNLARSEKTRKLVFVPTSDLTVLDPVVTFNRPTRNYAYLG